MSEREDLSGRSVAARVIERVLRDKAFTAAVLDAEIGARARFDARERALATEIAYGVLRLRGALTTELSRAAPRGLPSKDAFVLAHLLCAAYQILALDRVPSHGAVNEAVSAVKAKRGGRVGGFVNAVLRKVAAAREHFDRTRAAVESAPEWLVSEMERAVGAEETSCLLGASPAIQRKSCVRLLSGREIPEWLAAAEVGRISARARWVARPGDLRKREGYERGAFVVQEEGAQAVALALGARRGERILDACAGRGQKTSLLAEQIAPGGVLWATDRYPAKLEALRAEFERLNLAPPEVRALDWTVGAADVPADFDRVLVDAPCSGTGTLVRRPEILLRLEEDDIRVLAASSEAILRRAASRAKVGGRVVFAVCSVLRRECEQVVEAVGDVLQPVPFDAPDLPSALTGEQATTFRLLPREHGTDGFFVASFRRK